MLQIGHLEAVCQGYCIPAEIVNTWCVIIENLAKLFLFLGEVVQGRNIHLSLFFFLTALYVHDGSLPPLLSVSQ